MLRCSGGCDRFLTEFVLLSLLPGFAQHFVDGCCLDCRYEQIQREEHERIATFFKAVLDLHERVKKMPEMETETGESVGRDDVSREPRQVAGTV